MKPNSVDYTVTAWPAFSREIEGTLAVHAQFVVHGNVHDQYAVPAPASPDLPGHVRQLPCHLLPMKEVLWERLRLSGYACLITFDPVAGFDVFPPDDDAARQAAERLLPGVLGTRPRWEQMRAHLAAITGAPPPGRNATEGALDSRATTPCVRAALLIDLASRISATPASLTVQEHEFFLYCLKAAELAVPVSGGGRRPFRLFNPVIWLVDKEHDLPGWFTNGSERVRDVAVPKPMLDVRGSAAANLAYEVFRVQEDLHRLPADHPDNHRVKAFADSTDGLTLRAMEEISTLAQDRGLSFAEITDAIRIYKLGVDENPWRRAVMRRQIQDGQEMIQKRVLGQPRAVNRTLDILKRAALGLSGAQAPSAVNRPRGVIFFAGPTGVGKTELAKSVAGLLFGDQNAYLRFDMSEFAAEQAVDRLTGAPPGYVGYDQGGELTTAVRERPFQVVLFDEIEKAHPRLMDRFLQILEDGRLTDGHGETTHFSECVLIFTSNLGVVHHDEHTKEPVLLVDPSDGPEELEKRVLAAIRDHFRLKLGRPELLNRFGDNIVVFDFIDERTAIQIFDLQLGNIGTRLAYEHRLRLELSDQARAQLLEQCIADPLNGGRGIGNALEANLINPLARALFDREETADGVVVVDSIGRDANRIATLQLRFRPGSAPA
ncbi:AAA family ATPase [Catellatospora sp. KI3]|uniref:AAA family ATPase n=1 Tax=Catellatospora sp. KI3 TaxID=3041620 RepID=UPI002482A969|nr:AAA family ATPase [Catellatospora sp. KI3]MDI1462839.1 AAA family ATPase [Catellatospora sp. KI3]